MFCSLDLRKIEIMVLSIKMIPTIKTGGIHGGSKYNRISGRINDLQFDRGAL
jgi:hypothetical protein